MNTIFECHFLGLLTSAQYLLPQICIAGAKDHLLKMFQDREVIQFAEFYPAGHKQSNYKKWFGTKHPFPIRYAFTFMPVRSTSSQRMSNQKQEDRSEYINEKSSVAGPRLLLITSKKQQVVVR